MRAGPSLCYPGLSSFSYLSNWMRRRSHLASHPIILRNFAEAKEKIKPSWNLINMVMNWLKGRCSFTMPVCSLVEGVIHVSRLIPQSWCQPRWKVIFCLIIITPSSLRRVHILWKKKILTKTKWYLEQQIARNFWIVYIGMISKFFIIWKTVNRDYFGMQGLFLFFFWRTKR